MSQPKLMTQEWQNAGFVLIRPGDWKLPIAARTDERTLQLLDATGQPVLVAGRTAADVFTVTGAPPQIHPDPKRD